MRKSDHKKIANKVALHYQKRWPALRELKRETGGLHFLLLYDEKLDGYASFKKWSEGFSYQFPLCAGESLKTLPSFAEAAEKILPALAGYSRHETVIVAAGGGSLGDFAGFLASVLKRGVGLVSLPSTWLAAVDSAHGGKNGLNVGDLKNQLGTFYEPQAIYCIQELLELQPEANVRSAYGEVIKMSLIDNGELFSQLQKFKTFDEKNLWKILPAVVEAKYRVVNKDPLEKKGLRHLLNLGHTVGHAYELDKMLPHGLAVQLGLEFTAEWSRRRNMLSQKHYEQLKNLFSKNKMVSQSPISAQRLRLLLQQDKKAVSGDRVRFVFIQKPGRAKVEEVPIHDVVQMAHELGWVT